jgi:hypothetical protein
VSVRYTVLDRRAPRRAADAGLARIAAQVAADAASATPVDTGRLRRAWRVQRAVPGVRLVRNDTPYGRFVEYGTRRRRASAPLGRTVARWRNRTGFR